MSRPALSEEERFNRRTALLDAARRLYREQGTLPTVSRIAKAAGIAKGAVYLWFRSKEDIFVALLEAAILELIARLQPVVDSLDPRPEFAPDAFAARYVKLLGDVPDVVPLASVHSSVFRENLPIGSLSRLNRNVGAGLSKTGALLEQRFPCLAPGSGTELLLHTWTLTVGLWLMMDIPDEAREVLDDPALTIFQRGFHTGLKTAIAQLWRGAMTHRQSGGVCVCSQRSQ